MRTVVTLLIGLLCVVQFLYTWYLVIVMLRDFGVYDTGRLLTSLIMPLCLFLGGVFLVFGRRLSALFFIAYVLLYMYEMGKREDFGSLGSAAMAMGSLGNLVMAMGFVGYALWLWKLGELRGWPCDVRKEAAVASSEQQQP